MATIKSVQSSYLYSSSTADPFRKNWINAIDGDSSTSWNASSLSGTNRLILTGFDFSSLPQNAIITGISVTVDGRMAASGSSYYCSVGLVKNATSSSSYTDLGDGALRILNGTTRQTNTVDFPKAANACTVDFLKNNGLQLLWYTTRGFYVYEMYITVTYEDHTITVTTNASPTEGGTVTGGGTYESGSTVTVTAIPNNGYVFSHWLINGANSGNSNPISGVLTADTTVTAVFEKISLPEVSSVQITPNPCEAGQGFIISVGFSE